MLRCFIVFGIFCGGLAVGAEKSLTQIISELKRFYPHKEITISRTSTVTFVECLKCNLDGTNIVVQIPNSKDCGNDESLCGTMSAGGTGVSGSTGGNDPEK